MMSKLVVQRKNIFIFIALFLILVLGSWIRLSGFFSNSFAFTYDVGRDLLEIRKIVVDHHHLPLIGQTTGLEGLFYGPWWYYTLCIPFLLSSGNPQTIGFFIALSGIFTIYLAYIFGKELGGIFLGLIFAYFIAISPAMVGVATQIWNPNLAPMLLLLVIICMQKIYTVNSKSRNGGIKLFLWLGLLLGLIIDSEIVFGILLTISIWLSIIFFHRNETSIKNYFYLLLGMFFVFSPRIIFDLRHNFIMSRKIASLIFHPQFHQSFFPANVATTYAVFKHTWIETLGGGNEILGGILLVFVFFCLTVSGNKIISKKMMYLKIIGLTIPVYFFFLALFFHNAWTHYVVGIPVLFILLSSLTVEAFYQNIAKNKLSMGALCIFLFWINLSHLHFFESFYKPQWEGDAAVYRNQLAVVDFIYKHAKGKKFNYILYTPPVIDYTYKYLFLWYGKKMYGYTPTDSKASLFYVIMEPDYQNPFRLKEWLNFRKNDGTIVRQNVIKGGIIVQIRTH